MFSVFRHDYAEQQDRTHQEEFYALIDAIDSVEINHLLTELEVQKKKLENECLQPNATMLDRQKNVLVAGVYNSITQTLSFMQNKFNEVKEHNEIEVLKARLELLNICIHKVLHILSDDFSTERLTRSLEVLNSHRDTMRNFTLYPLHYGIVGTAVILGGPASLLGAIGMGLASHIGLRISENLLGINAETTSLKLISKLYNQLNNLCIKTRDKLEILEPGESKRIFAEIWQETFDKYDLSMGARNLSSRLTSS